MGSLAASADVHSCSAYSDTQNCFQAGQKRTKPVDEPNALVEGVQALPADGGAKQALENEFECTICRVRVDAALMSKPQAKLCFDVAAMCRTLWWPHTLLYHVATCSVVDA